MHCYEVHAPVFSNNSLNNLWSSKCFYYIDAGSLHKCLFVPLPALSLYSFDQLDRLVFLWQIAVWLNWFLNIFLGNRRQGISGPLLSYVTKKLEPLPMFYDWTVEHRQGSTISDLYESRSEISHNQSTSEVSVYVSKCPSSALEICPFYREFCYNRMTDKWRGTTLAVRLIEVPVKKELTAHWNRIILQGPCV